MPTLRGAHALELEALVARCARVGRLDPYELLETYVELEPSGHERLAEPRVIDLDALRSALSSLPAELVTAPRVLVVPRLSAFGHRPVPSAAGAAGVLADGTLLLEARFGLLSLVGIAAALCAIAHELDKARTLNPPDEEEVCSAPTSRSCRIGGGRRAAAAPDTAGASRAHASGHELEPDASDRHHLDDAELDDDPDEAEPDDVSDDEAAPDDDVAPHDEAERAPGDNLEDSDSTPVDVDVNDDEDDASPRAAGALHDATTASLAFTLGLDERRLLDANAALSGRLLTVLAPSWELPPVAVHAELETRACRRRVEARAERVAARLAELGLATRRLHLWVGSGVVVSCLSPYTRDLRDVLLGWAGAHPDIVGPDIDLAAAPGEDTLYALAADFLATDPRLAVERDAADRTVGIQRLDADGLPFELVDLGRVDPRMWDARLGSVSVPPDAPVLVRVSTDLEDGTGAGLASLLRVLGEHIASVTVLLEGTALEHLPGTVLLPAAAMRWAGESLVSLPGARALEPSELAGLAGTVVQGGVVLSAAHTSLLSTKHLAELARAYALRAVDVGGAATLSAVAEVAATGAIAPACALRWALVATELISRGRPSVASTSGLAAYAIATLRELLADGANRPAPAPPRDRPRPSSGRTVRIKA